ncbi:GntR family transcriptional regulator [Microbacterium laevaniformans]|uniref:GntR family transcriptional regulator n=1 Tax=Microbacterium laevaniformans TaxID=36807 RepID=A0A4S2D1D7_9MICO|nr:GntR family transcriptional regulator [Microbacterium laevaniformans]TGY34681.1 GntR family transcriptional regulator [Microbacterium laevaniformans]
MTDVEESADDSLAATAYRRIRTAIILGRYADGAAITEGRLADELEMSRIPIRAAILQLGVDGFLATSPRRSARVVGWDRRAIDELFDVRLSLESLAARLAAQNAGRGASVAALERALDAAHDAVTSGDRLTIAEAHAAFHAAIVEMADSTLLTSLTRVVSGRLVWLFYLTGVDRDAREQSHEHDELLAAIADGNARLAESLAFSHIEKGRAPSMEIILPTTTT